jgi:hypothetical protein
MLRLKSLLFENSVSIYLEQIYDEILSQGYISHSDFLDILRKKEYNGLSLLANQFGETPQAGKYMMSGAFSLVWWLQSGKVIKISSNSYEVETAAYYRTRPKTKHIISYYDVREILFNGLSTKWYAIITDGVRTLTTDEQDWYTVLTDDCGFFESRWSDTQVFDEFIDNTINVPGDGIDFVQKLLSQRQSILQDVSRFNVATYEAHAGNVGFDENDQFVIFDIWSGGTKTEKGIARRLNKPIDLYKLILNQPDTSGIDTTASDSM